jgi:hypothetical protein
MFRGVNQLLGIRLIGDLSMQTSAAVHMSPGESCNRPKTLFAEPW